MYWLDMVVRHVSMFPCSEAVILNFKKSQLQPCACDRGRRGMRRSKRGCFVVYMTNMIRTLFNSEKHKLPADA